MHTLQLVLVEILMTLVLQLQQPLANLLRVFCPFYNQDHDVQKPEDDKEDNIQELHGGEQWRKQDYPKLDHQVTYHVGADGYQYR